MKRSRKVMAFIVLIIALLVLIAAGATLFSSCISRSQAENQRYATEDLLSGSELRYMMNQAKHSPGDAENYIKDHPSFAWLFDGSFVTYVEED